MSDAPKKRNSRNSGRPAPRARTADSGAPALRARLGLTRPEFARLVGVSERTLAGWERAPVTNAAEERALKELRSVVDACERVMQPVAVGSWLVTPNKAFGGLEPVELIERGESERVLRALFFVEAGIPL